MPGQDRCRFLAVCGSAWFLADRFQNPARQASRRVGIDLVYCSTVYCSTLSRHPPRVYHCPDAMTTLFPQLAPSSPPPDGPFAAVALERGIDRTLDYRIPPALAADLQIGQRVRVPLGRKNRPARGYVVGIHAEAGHPQVGVDQERSQPLL